MKRNSLVLGLAALMASGVVFAGPVEIAAGATKTVTTAAGECPLLSETVNLQISKNSVGGYDCTTGSYIGVGSASVAGAKKVFKGSSAGGKITDQGTTACSATICTATEAAAAATLGSNGS